MKAAVAVLLVALAAHLTYFAIDRDPVATDTKKYVEPAQSMLAGQGFARRGVIETIRTPGYPVFLVPLFAMGWSLRSVVLLHHLALAAAAVALLLLVRRMTGNGFIAAAAALLWAIDLPTIALANVIHNETLFTLLGLWFFAIVWRMTTPGRQVALWHAAGAGLLLGAMTLVRPVSILFFIPIGLYLAWYRRDLMLRVVPVFAIAAWVLPAAWIARNARLGQPTISTNYAILMLDFHAAGSLAIDDPGGPQANLDRRMAEVRRIADARVRSQLGIQDLRKLPHIRRAEIDAQVGREIVRAHPVAFAKVIAYGIALNLLGGNAEALTQVTPLSRGTAIRLLLVYTGSCLLLAIVGLIRLWKTNQRLAVLIFLTVSYYILVTAGVFSYSRFRVPVVPMYAIAIAAGIEALRTRNSGGGSGVVGQ